MADIVSPEVRSRMMSGIRGANTKPELLIRKGLHRLGFRFRLHDRRLPGRPDLVLPKYNAAIFVHGCFWHGHSCHLFKAPTTRAQFWQAKVERNRQVDARAQNALAAAGWRQAVIWECSLKGRTRLSRDVLLNRCANWLRSDRKKLEISGDM